MEELTISLACGDYARTRALREGQVRIEGARLIYLRLPPADLFWRMLKHEEFDASEMSLSAYIMGISRGDTRFVAIPVFPSRVFRHSFIFVNKRAHIRTPKDLAGKRVGVPEYHMTAGMFTRGMLADDYGVRPADIQWFQGGIEAPGREERVTLQLPPGVTITPVKERTIDDMLLAGDLDAIFTATVPPSVRAGSDAVARLFDDPKRVESEYYRRTKIFPIMHTVVIRRPILDRYPWLSMGLRRAFEESKRDYYQRLSESHNDPGCGMPFAQYELEETRALFGQDFWPYGVEENLPTLEAAVRFSFEQGLSARRVTVGELFDPRSITPSVE